ncbi:hypothetical protein [Actinoplanes regularis]|uniref:hypothetical protein n=1 Tax=Actinoplanes regularis TaxID=52697 RepID=UPI0024A50091|nr:hypothetical protein [Actinoplanes regularis]GLW34944.1 hypothetical protein Areg01_78800 [Actinoplanes regularis]
MREPPKPYEELSLEELADWIVQLVNAADSTRLEINLALAEVYRRHGVRVKSDSERLYEMSDALEEWLQRDANRRMGWPRRGDRPPRSCGSCMCSATRLEPRAGGGD